MPAPPLEGDAALTTGGIMNKNDARACLKIALGSKALSLTKFIYSLGNFIACFYQLPAKAARQMHGTP